MKDKKKIMIAILLILVCIMTIAYAYLAQQLNINGHFSIGSNWKIEITDIKEKEKSIGASSKTNPSYTATTASFDAGFISPGDYIIYEIEISNLGTLDAIVDSITVSTPDSKIIKYTISGMKEQNKIPYQTKKKFEIRIEYRPEIISQPSNLESNLTLTINFVESFGNEEISEESEDIIVTLPEYAPGDKITFAGSDWCVVANSDYDQDYVTVMKERVLTNSELASYAYNSSYDTMIFHNSSNDYSNSRIKTFLEDTYINVLGSSNLKMVDGYRIRLITIDELMSNLGYSWSINSGSWPIANNNVPTWVYQNFGEGQNNVYAYWTMSKYANTNDSVWYVSRYGNLNQIQPYGTSYAVRPVINLLKSAIE